MELCCPPLDRFWKTHALGIVEGLLVASSLLEVSTYESVRLVLQASRVLAEGIFLNTLYGKGLALFQIPCP